MPQLIIRAALLLLLIGGGGLLAAGLIQDPGRVSISWGGWIAEAHAATLVLAVAALLVVFWLTWSFLAFLFGLPGAFGQYSRERRHEKGLDALARAFIAYAAEDGKTALANARKAERLLANPHLTRALMAKSLELGGETKEAHRYHLALAGDSLTAPAGVRGLLADAVREGDTCEALEQARRAVELGPRDVHALRSLLKLQTQAGNWADVRRTLTGLARTKALAPAEGRRKEAAAFTAEALEAERRGDNSGARGAAMSAVELDRGLAPAVQLAARFLSYEGDRRRAERILLQAWRNDPAQELAAAWAALDPEENPEARKKRFQRLTDVNPSHPESRLLMAELAISRRDWAEARDALGPLARENPSSRVCAVMAAVEKGGHGNDEAARDWLARALSAPHGKYWNCAECGAARNEWIAVCPDCQALGAVRMRDPPVEAATSAGIDLLPALLSESRAAQLVKHSEGTREGIRSIPSPAESAPQETAGVPERVKEARAQVIRPDA